KGVRIRQLLVFAALGREWWAWRRSVLSVSDPRERAARGPAGADRAPSSARCAFVGRLSLLVNVGSLRHDRAHAAASHFSCARRNARQVLPPSLQLRISIQ